VTNLIDGLKVPLYGDGSNVRDWLHVDDHCRGIYLALMFGRAGEVYNIGGGTELSNLELTNRVISLMHKDSSSIQYVNDRLGHDIRYSVSITKISEELGYRPSIFFDEGLARTINWYQEREDWWRPLKM
jgi:dTDP-glucose 4,6-dehydratase